MLRSRLRADDGFTLVELLVVTLIVGILAAIGLATLLNQRGKAQDAEAKTTVVTGAKAIEAYATDHGDYEGATAADLSKIEPSLAQARNLSVSSTKTTYSVSVDSAAAQGADVLDRAHSRRRVRPRLRAARDRRLPQHRGRPWQPLVSGGSGPHPIHGRALNSRATTVDEPARWITSATRPATPSSKSS